VLLTLLVVVCVLAVLFVAASVAVSDRDLLVDVTPDGSGTTLPAGRVLPEDVDAVRFGLAFRGYRMDEVDRALARLAQELAERDARVDELERAIADAVGGAVDQAEARLAAEHAREAEEAERAEAEAQLAAAREEGRAASGPVEPTTGLAAVAAWSPVTTTSVSAPWSVPAVAAPAEVAEPAAPAEATEPAAPAEATEPAAPAVSPEPHAPQWPAAEPSHPEPLVPESLLEERDRPGAAPVGAGMFDDFPEVVPPVQAASGLPEATEHDTDHDTDQDRDEDRGITRPSRSLSASRWTRRSSAPGPQRPTGSARASGSSPPA